MKSSKRKMAAVLLAAAFALTGCGEAFYDLTPEERNAVVSYASRVVAKYNTYQKDGEVFVMQEILDGEEESEEDLQVDATEEEDSQETSEAAGQETDGTEASGEDAQAGQETASLREALELGEVTAEYTDSSLCATYEKSDVYAVDAGEGQQLLVLHIKLVNSSGQDAHVDMLKAMPKVRVVVNETETAAAQTTILPNDLLTYQGDLAAGEERETALLFQIPQEIGEVESLQLHITMNGETRTVSL